MSRTKERFQLSTEFVSIPKYEAYDLTINGEVLVDLVTERHGRQDVPVKICLFYPLPSWYSEGCRIAKVDLLPVIDSIKDIDLDSVLIDGRACKVVCIDSSSKNGSVIVSLNDTTDRYIKAFMTTANNLRAFSRGSLAFPFPVKGGAFKRSNINVFSLPMHTKIYGGLTEAAAKTGNIANRSWETKLIDGASMGDNALFPFLKPWTWEEGKLSGADLINLLPDFTDDELQSLIDDLYDLGEGVVFGTTLNNREQMTIKDNEGNPHTMYADVLSKTELFHLLRETERGKELADLHPVFLEQYGKEIAQKLFQIATGGDIKPAYDGKYGFLYVASTREDGNCSTVKEAKSDLIALRHPLLSYNSIQIINVVVDDLGNIPVKAYQCRNNLNYGQSFDKCFILGFDFQDKYALAITPDGQTFLIPPRSLVHCEESLKVGSLPTHSQIDVDFNVINVIHGDECLAMPDSVVKRDKSIDGDDLIGVFTAPPMIIEKVRSLPLDMSQADKLTKSAGRLTLDCNQMRVKRQMIEAAILGKKAISLCHKLKNFLSQWSESERDAISRQLFKVSYARLMKKNSAFWQAGLDSGKAFEVMLSKVKPYIQKLEEVLNNCVYSSRFSSLAPKKAIFGRENKPFLNGLLPRLVDFYFEGRQGNLPRLVEKALIELQDLEWAEREAKPVDEFVNFFGRSEAEPLQIAKNAIASYYYYVKRLNLAQVIDETGALVNAFAELNDWFNREVLPAYVEDLARFAHGLTYKEIQEDFFVALWNESHMRFDGSFLFHLAPKWILEHVV